MKPLPSLAGPSTAPPSHAWPGQATHLSSNTREGINAIDPETMMS